MRKTDNTIKSKKATNKFVIGGICNRKIDIDRGEYILPNKIKALQNIGKLTEIFDKFEK